MTRISSVQRQANDVLLWPLAVNSLVVIVASRRLSAPEDPFSFRRIAGTVRTANTFDVVVRAAHYIFASIW